MKPDAEIFDCRAERLLSRVRVCGKRFERPLLPEGEFLAGWTRGARFRLGDRMIALFRYWLVTWPIPGAVVDVAAERGTPKVRAILRALGVPGWEALPVHRDEVRLLQVLQLEPSPGLGSVVRGMRPAGPDDVAGITDEIFDQIGGTT